MAQNPQAISDLIGSLYEAVANPDHWNDFLALVSEAFGCDKAALILVPSGNERPSMSVTTGMDPDAMKDYNTYYGPRNPVLATLINTPRRRGSLEVLGRSLNPATDYEKTEYYNDWGRKYGVYHVVHGVAAGDAGDVTSLSVMRPKTGGPLEADALELMALLTPHLKRSFRIHSEMETLRARNEAVESCPETFETALFAADGRGRIVFFNEAAERLLENEATIRIVGRKLSVFDRTDARILEQLIVEAVNTGAGRGLSPGGVMLLHRRFCKHPLHVTVAPFNSSHILTAERPCALILISDPVAKLKSRGQTLSALYSLTPAECRLCDLLLDGLELPAIGEKMHITVNTARFMLKAIFHKTGTKRQSHLLRFLLLLPADAKARC